MPLAPAGNRLRIYMHSRENAKPRPFFKERGRGLWCKQPLPKQTSVREV